MKTKYPPTWKGHIEMLKKNPHSFNLVFDQPSNTKLLTISKKNSIQSSVFD